VVGEVFMSVDAMLASQAIDIPFPVVAKIDSPDLPHKTEAGAVKVGIQNLEQLKTAVQEMLTSSKKYKKDARISGVSVQEMAKGVEVIIGAVNDPFFGPTVIFGLGGIFTELLKDISMRFAPVSIAEAKSMIMEIKASKLLTGYRGKPSVDIDQLSEIIHKISWLAYDYQDQISDIDVNPLFADGHTGRIAAADALIVLKT